MENINVYIRFKPSSSPNESNFQINSNSLYNNKTNETFHFDNIIPHSISNETLYENVIKDTISSLFKGINISIFTYGQTSTGKSYTMKGKNDEHGLISLMLKDILSYIEESLLSKCTVKISYIEIYNENINDILTPSKKNLEIKDSITRGAYVHGVTELNVDNYDKVLKIINQAEKTNDNNNNSKHSKINTIFKVNIEYKKKVNDNDKEKTFVSQLNLIELAGSENISINNNKNNTFNKSILTFNSIITKLSQNIKTTYINYKESKLTRLLQYILTNSKISFICTAIDDNVHYNETLHTINFALKVKNVKTNPKVNEVSEDKGKVQVENNQIKSKIKILQDLIKEKKEKGKNIKPNNNTISTNTNSNNTNTKITSKNLSSLLCTADKKITSSSQETVDRTKQISTLEKEVALLKRLLINNKDDIKSDNISANNDLHSVQSGNLYQNLTKSGYKTIYNRMPGMTNPQPFQDSSALKSPFNPYHPPLYANNDNNNINTANAFQEPSYSAYRRNCVTEMRGFPQFTNTVPTNKLYTSNTNEYEFHCGMNNDLFKENEELRRNLYEMRKTYYEVVQSKENQIKLLNQNHSMTLENCEKLIKEAEDNYIKLKLNYDQAQEELKNKDNELIELNNKFINQESSINYYKDEIAKMKEMNCFDDIIQIKEENENLKLANIETITKMKETLKHKESECMSLKEEIEKMKTKYEKEISKLKSENKTLKSSSSTSNNNNNNNKKNIVNKNTNDCVNKKLISEYEDKLLKVEQEKNEYKNNLEFIKETQITEYQKLLDESFDKIRELNRELIETKDKLSYIEKAFQIVENTNNNSFINNTNEKNNTPQCYSKSNNKLLGKKRKYMPQSKENINYENIQDAINEEISTFQI